MISEANSKPVAMLDDDLKIVKIFKNGVQARDWLIANNKTCSKYANSEISKSIKRHVKAFGYYWGYTNEGVETMDDECNPVG